MKNSCCKYLLRALLLLLITGISMAGCNPFSPQNKTIKCIVRVDMDAMIRDMENDPADSGLNEAIADAGKAAGGADTDHIALFAAAYMSAHPGGHLAALFVKPEQHDITLNSTDDAVIALLETQAHAAVQQTCSVLQKRLSKVGDGSSAVVGDGKTGKITVTVKTTYSAERLKKYLEKKGEIAFYETYKNEELLPVFADIDGSMGGGIQEPKKDIDTSHNDAVGGDTGSLAQYVNKGTGETKGRTKKEPGSTSLLHVLFANINQANEVIKGPIVGYIRARDTGLARKILNGKIASTKLPQNAHIVYAKFRGIEADTSSILWVYAIKMPPPGASSIITTDDLTGAKADVTPATKLPCVLLRMTPQGAVKWKKLTGDNIGNFIAVMVDGQILSCPRVDNEIRGGNTEITGGFTQEEAQDMANSLSCGRLPFPVTVTESGVTNKGEEKSR